MQILKDMFAKIELNAKRATVVYKEPNIIRIRDNPNRADISLVELQMQ